MEADQSTADRPEQPLRTETRELVRILLASGMNGAQIAETLGISKSTVSHHMGGLGVPRAFKYARRYDWDEVQRYYDQGHSITECQQRFGFARKTFMDAVKRGGVKTRPHGVPLEELLSRAAVATAPI